MRYLVPDNIDIKSEFSCSLSFQSTTITGEQSLTNTFKQDVGFEVGGSYEGFGASFKASTSYSTMSKSMSDYNKVYVDSNAKCIVYKASVQTL